MPETPTNECRRYCGCDDIAVSFVDHNLQLGLWGMAGKETGAVFMGQKPKHC